MIPELGIIEGRFGRTWTWPERTTVLRLLAAEGYGFYHYAPKGDAHLRRDWRSRHSAEEEAQIATFSSECHDLGVRFGMALTPIGVTHPFDAQARQDLGRRLAELEGLGLDDLGILFDDLRGDLPDLAATQADVVNFCVAQTSARVYFCPTYYSTDPVLDIVFGARPAGYLEELGRLLAPDVRVFWTGEEVCAREIRPGHIERVSAALGRPICLWDNYPVNDGARMSRHLHLRAFTGRSVALGQHVAAHAINPALQPWLTCIPAVTLRLSYERGEAYQYGSAFEEAARTIVGAPLARMLREDLAALQDLGHDRLGDRLERLRSRYASQDHPAAREVLRWLDGDDLMAGDVVRTQ